MGCAAQGLPPLGRPEAGTWPMDTRDFAKVAGRLGRALGHVDACAAAVPAMLKALHPTREEGDAIRGHLRGIVAGSRRLLRLVAGSGTAETARGEDVAKGTRRSPRGGRACGAAVEDVRPGEGPVGGGALLRREDRHGRPPAAVGHAADAGAGGQDPAAVAGAGRPLPGASRAVPGPRRTPTGTMTAERGGRPRTPSESLQHRVSRPGTWRA